MEEDKTTTEPQKEQDNDNEEKENQELAKITKQDKTSYIKLFERIKATECKMNKQCKYVKDLTEQSDFKTNITSMENFKTPLTQLQTEL